ncbi:hypothetical protein Sipo8835_07595 [Streptomyces ipomoeae]|uniref:Restriction endonuclease type IV Mrr domain-containing protein n=1 Tax=Streptomyces ipomoeae TaxID=103232 RepID=A0AAE9B1N2_9ACTN|nr:hypothetical protein Sipo8835_07595 [Streptomyces ipomoeae]
MTRVITEAALRGYLLEEVLAWLLKSSGYELLTEEDDRDVLAVRQHGLVVRGRGAWHQADVLGEFRYVPPFSLPVRLFLEAKFTNRAVNLPTVRNGHGVIHDVNEGVLASPRSSSSQPRRPRPRYQYSYAIFSTSGFTKDAQEYALAHQISLIDLSMPNFHVLRDLVRETAEHVHEALNTLPQGGSPRIHHLRDYLRYALHHGGAEISPPLPSVTEPLDALASSLRSRSTLGLVLAFPSAPFVLGLAPDDLKAFVGYCREHPTHAVRLRRAEKSGAHRTWTLRSASDPGAYEMAFGLPKQVEDWILAQEETVRSRTSWVKKQLLSTMTVYWLDGDHAHTFHLRYEPAELRSS